MGGVSVSIWLFGLGSEPACRPVWRELCYIRHTGVGSRYDMAFYVG